MIFERKGYEHTLDETKEHDFNMPKNFIVIKSDENTLGMISSTEIRKRISEAKSQMDENQEIKNAKYFYNIAGLVTSSTIEMIRKNELY